MKVERVATVEITELLKTTDTGLWVRIKATGKLAWLPRSKSYLMPGLAVIPEWLAAKICPPAAPTP